MKKRIIAIILTVVTVIASFNMMVFATENPTLNIGEEITVTQDEISFEFTTQEAGLYVAASSGNTYLWADIYNEDGDLVAFEYCNAQNGMDFYLETVLDANKTYTISLRNRFPDAAATNYVLSIEKKQYDGTLTVGNETKISRKESYCSFTPLESGYYFIYTTGSEDTNGELYDSKANCIYTDDNMGLDGNYRLEYYLNAGETYSIYTKIWEMPDIVDVGICVAPFDSEGVVEAEELHTVNDKWDVLTFVPTKTATYRLYSLADEEVDAGYYGQIYNSDFEVVSVINEELYSNCNFYTEAELTAGETYYLDVFARWYYDSTPETFVVTICEISPITSLEIIPIDGTVAGVGEDLHCELVIGPENHKNEEITWYIEPERVGRIEYSGDWGASIELHSPGTARVVAYSENYVYASYNITCEGELPELELNETQEHYMDSWEIHSYSFTAPEEGMYGILSRGNDLDLKCSVYELDDTTPNKTVGDKGEGDNFNLQFYNLTPNKTYIIEVKCEYDENDTETYSGNYEIMAYKCTEDIEGIKLSVDDNLTVYENDYDDIYFSVSVLPETALQDALETTIWTLEGDYIGWQTVYGRSFAKYRFTEAGTATLTASVNNGQFTDSCIIECKELGYADILLDEVVTIDADAHYSEGWFRFVPEEDGMYTVYSTGEADTYLTAYSYSEELDDDSGYNYNFKYTIELSAGEEFFFEAERYEWIEADFNVSICKAHTAESLTIIEHSNTVKEPYNLGSFYVVFGNGGADFDYSNEIMWSISDKSIAEINYVYGDYLELYFVGEGELTITVETANGLSNTYTIYIGEEPPTENTEIGDVNGDSEINALDLINLKTFLLSGGGDNSDYDINKDGEVDVRDLVRLKKLSADSI